MRFTEISPLFPQLSWGEKADGGGYRATEGGRKGEEGEGVGGRRGEGVTERGMAREEARNGEG